MASTGYARRPETVDAMMWSGSVARDFAEIAAWLDVEHGGVEASHRRVVIEPSPEMLTLTIRRAGLPDRQMRVAPGYWICFGEGDDIELLADDLFRAQYAPTPDADKSRI